MPARARSDPGASLRNPGLEGARDCNAIHARRVATEGFETSSGVVFRLGSHQLARKTQAPATSSSCSLRREATFFEPIMRLLQILMRSCWATVRARPSQWAVSKNVLLATTI